MRKRFLIPIIIFSILLLVLGGVALWLLYPSRPELLIISDKRYLASHLPIREEWELRFSLAKRGKKLRIETIDWEILAAPEELSARIEAMVSDAVSMVVLSPLVTTQGGAWTSRLDQLAGDGITSVGLGTAPDGSLDFFLIRDIPSSGWAQAAQALSVLTGNNPLPTVLLYTPGDPQVDADADLFAGQFTDRVLEILPVSGKSQSEIDATMRKISDMGALFVVSPYLDGLDQYSLGSDGLEIRWIVDASYSQVIPESSREGVVSDDLNRSLTELLDDGSLGEEGNPAVRRTLYTTYRSEGRAW